MMTLAGVALFLWASGLVAQDVRFNFDKSFVFSPLLQTYKWVAMPDAPAVDQLTDKDIKATVNAELRRKGFKIAEGDKADLELGYRSSIAAEKQDTSYTTGWGDGPGWWGGWGVGGWSSFSSSTTSQTSTIYIGQLELAFYHAGDLIWRGSVSQTLDPTAKPEKQQKRLQKAVAKLLKQFPPSFPIR